MSRPLRVTERHLATLERFRRGPRTAHEIGARVDLLDGWRRSGLLEVVAIDAAGPARCNRYALTPLGHDTITLCRDLYARRRSA